MCKEDIAVEIARAHTKDKKVNAIISMYLAESDLGLVRNKFMHIKI